jgi:hypothetical protein
MILFNGYDHTTGVEPDRMRRQSRGDHGGKVGPGRKKEERQVVSCLLTPHV